MVYTCPIFQDNTKSFPIPDVLLNYLIVNALLICVGKQNPHRTRPGRINTNPLYLHKLCLQQETCWNIFCYKLTRSVQFSSIWQTTIQNHRSEQQIQCCLFHVMLFTFTCYTCFAIDAGRYCHESIQLHRNKADIAHLIILLTLWKRGVRTQVDKGCFPGCSPILLLNSVCYKMSFFPQYICLATESQSVESSHGYCAVN